MWFALPFHKYVYTRWNICQFIFREQSAVSLAISCVILVANKLKLIKMEVKIYLAFHYVRWIMPQCKENEKSAKWRLTFWLVDVIGNTFGLTLKFISILGQSAYLRSVYSAALNGQRIHSLVKCIRRILNLIRNSLCVASPIDQMINEAYKFLTNLAKINNC